MHGPLNVKFVNEKRGY